jgi:hypothetical protein
MNTDSTDEYFCYHIDCSFRPTKCYYCYKIHMQTTTYYIDRDGTCKEHKILSLNDLDDFLQDGNKHDNECEFNHTNKKIIIKNITSVKLGSHNL